ncbi:MAG: hypothetical protein HZC55_14775 [Verrucomicrobia bacterium]|nr:hypothetical protein [Verrucomicrobiota bacterium]
MNLSARLLRPSWIALSLIAACLRAQDAETWQSGYTGAEATGPRVLGYWRFEPGAETADSSGRGHTLTFAGAVASPTGKFGGALESFPGGATQDVRHAALAAARPTLSPQGAFSLEMWIKPKADLRAEASPVLVDKKYVAHSDYQWRLTAADKGGARRLLVSLGFGEASETYRSEPFTLGTEWQHLAFTYDGAGEVRFFRNGGSLGGGRQPGRGPITAGPRALSLGDRGGSTYAGFPGWIDEVRLCDGAREFRPFAVSFEIERRTWRRMEAAPTVRVVVRNLTKGTSAPAALKLGWEGLEQVAATVPSLAAGASQTVPVRFDTTLRPDTYRLVARLETTGEPRLSSEESIELTLVGRPLPHQMPVVMWGINSPDAILKELPRLQDLGFTHCLAGGVDFGRIWEAKSPIAPVREDRLAATRAMLDHALARDFGIALTLSPGHWLKERPDLQRVDRTGKPYAPRGDVNAALPGLAEFGFNVGASLAQAYHAYPAWQAALINTEVRDSSQPSFSAADQAAYRAFAGVDIPAEITTKRGVDWRKLPGFPADRVIPDDHPVRRYLHWFWTVGDGWNPLHTAVHRGLHSTGRDDVWTWFDPAIRAASVGGSGGSVDVLSQWTYTNPDPPRIGYFADELFAMAAAAPHRPRVMKMTQLFWYRTQSAPKKAGPEHIASPFDDHDPDAAYITIAPLHLRESFWMKLARPVDGLMYHGWQALVPTDSTSGYRYTHPDTKEEFRRLHRELLARLGPTLRQVGDRRSDVAYLDSFTAQMFAGRGSYGYSNEEAYLALLHAQLQPEVLFEETLLQRGLAGYRLLVLADCDVLPASVVARIQEFQRNDGLVLGDENLAPAIRPDLRFPRLTRQRKGDVDHAAILAQAARIRDALAKRYRGYAESSEPEVITRTRTTGEADYVFVVNDRREFGNYVGQHGLVMEHGLPATAQISVGRTDGHIYDLFAGRPVPSTARDRRLSWTAALGPGDGGVYLVVPRPIRGVEVSGPDTLAPGASAEFTAVVRDDAAKPVAAVVPVHLLLQDPAGRIAERSGYYGAKDGTVRVSVAIATNDRPGLWTMQVRELASGTQARHSFRVAGPTQPKR